MKPSLTILEGDVLDRLADIPDQTVQTCVSSPPYWALRDYKIAPTSWPEVTFVPVAGLPPVTIPAMKCCLGHEKDPWAFVAHLVHVYRLLWPVMKDDATIWVNLGDSYSATGSGAYGKEKEYGAMDGRKSRRPSAGLKNKDLCGIPWRVAQALQADGWYLRCDVIWHKPNPMPESCRDRPTKAHEYMFFMSKKAKYFYDQKAILEPASWNTHARRSRAEMWHKSNPDRERNGIRPAKIKMPDGWMTGKGSHHGSIHPEGRQRGKTRKLGTREDGVKNNPSYEEAMCDLVDNRNKRSVWSVPSAPFKEAHFATFPPDLIRPCIMAGSRPGDIVLDHFGGSGTVGMVSLELGRSTIIIEGKHEYVEMIRRRCEPSELERNRLIYEAQKLPPLPLFETLEAVK